MFNIHNDREKILIKYLYEECTLCSFILDFDGGIYYINVIRSFLYMLDRIEESIIVNNYYILSR